MKKYTSKLVIWAITVGIILSLFLPPISATNWVVYKNNPQHTGVASAALEPPLELLWKFKTDGPIVSSPAVYDGVLYFGSGDYYVYALDSLTGELKWKFKTDGRVDASPAVWGNTVYVGSLDGTLYALDAKTGRVKWKFKTLGQILSSPVVGYGIVFFGSTDGFVYALNASTGEKKWAFRTGGKIETSPAVYGQLLIVGSYDGKVYAFGAKGGGIIWTFDAGEPITSWAVVVDSGTVYVIAGSKYLYALDVVNGEVKWKKEIGFEVNGYQKSVVSYLNSENKYSPSIIGGSIVIHYYKHVVVCGGWGLNCKWENHYYIIAEDTQNGQTNWQSEVGGPVQNAPTVSGATVYFGCNDGYLYALHADNGELKWKYLINSSIRSSPVVANGILYVGADDGYLYAFASSEFIGVYSALKELRTSINNAKNNGMVIPTALNTAVANAESHIRNGELDEAKGEIEDAKATLNTLLKAYNSTTLLLSQINNYIKTASNYGLNASTYLQTRIEIESYLKSGDYEKAETLASQLKLQIESDYKAVLDTEIENITKILEEERRKGVVTTPVDSLVSNVKGLVDSGEYLKALSEMEKIHTELQKLELEYTQAKQQLDQVKTEYTSMASQGFNVTDVEQIILNANSEFEKGDYQKAIELTKEAEVELQKIKDTEAERAKSMLSDVGVEVNNLKQIVNVSEFERNLSVAKSKIGSGEYPSAIQILIEIDQRLKTIREANNAILTAEATIKQEEEKGFDVSKAEKLIASAKRLFGEGKYGDAKKYAEQATLIAQDIDQDGIVNEKDRFPNINNHYLYSALIALLIITIIGIKAFPRRKRKKLGQSGVKINEKRRPAQKPSETQKPEEKPASPSVPGFPSQLATKYEPLEFLGEGGFARVYKVRRKSDGKIVAVKIPRINEKTSSLFLKEVAAWYNLNHPNIVRLYKADIFPIPHLEMEYVEGTEVDGKLVRNLDEYTKPGDEETALRLIRGIAEGLKHAHGKGVYHFDLKPQNILLKANLTPKITDWGLAKISARSSLSTHTGYSPLYAAPEQLDEDTYGKPDHRTDIYGLGVIFYELLTGKLPYEGYSPGAVVGKILARDVRPNPPSKFDPTLTKYDGILERLLAKRKEDRYGSVEQFLKDLDSIEELDREREELKKSLEKTRETLKSSRSREEIRRLMREAVEKTAKIALLSAKLNDRAELLNALDDLKFYTRENLDDLLNAITQIELLLNEEIPISEELVEKLKVLLHRIQREVEK